MKKSNLLAMTCLSFLLYSCASGRNARVISEEKITTGMTWSEEDRTKVLAVQTLKITPEASYHWIRLNGAEKSHIHKEHDLAVFILKGKARFYFADHKIDVKSGDVIEIPRGKIHRAEKKSKEPVEVYAVFTPPFDGKDHHELSEEK